MAKRVELVLGRRVGGEEPLGEPHRAEIRADPFARRDQLGRAAADVDDDRAGGQVATAGSAPERELCLLLAGQQARREPVAPLDLAEERLAVVGVADRARRNEQGALSAERLELAPVVGEAVAHARDRQRQELVPGVDALAEARDRRPPHDLVHSPVGNVRHQQASRVRALIDGGNTHQTVKVTAAIIPARRGVEQSGSSPGS